MTEKRNICVLASGSGTNLQSLIDHAGKDDASFRIALVISDRKDAFSLSRAGRHNIPGLYIRYSRKYPEKFAKALQDKLREYSIDIIVLAGFLKYVPKEVLSEYRNRVVNIHPALLPSFGGAGMYGINVHRSVLEYGCKISGVTVHFVNDEYDAGPVIAQLPVRVRSDDTPETLQKRVLEKEHILLPQVVQALSLGIVKVEGRVVSLRQKHDGIESSYFGAT